MRREKINEAFALTSFLHGANAAYIEDLYERFQENPGSVTADWRAFFTDLKERKDAVLSEAHGPSWKHQGQTAYRGMATCSTRSAPTGAAKSTRSAARSARKAQEKGVEISREEAFRATRESVRALMLIRAYRVNGHLIGNLDPLHLAPPRPHPELDPASYGFTPADLDHPIYIDNVLGLETATLRADHRDPAPDLLRHARLRVHAHLLSRRRSSGCRSASRAWTRRSPSRDLGKKAILTKLIQAESLEKFLDKKYTGTKRFGLEGAEAMVPALEQIIKRGGQLGVKEIVLGMPHRGRLNVLANVMGKPFRALFHEFQGGSSPTRRTSRARAT